MAPHQGYLVARRPAGGAPAGASAGHRLPPGRDGGAARRGLQPHQRRQPGRAHPELARTRRTASTTTRTAGATTWMSPAAATPSPPTAPWRGGCCWSRCAAGPWSWASTASASISASPSAAARSWPRSTNRPCSRRSRPTPNLSDLKLVSEPWDCGGLYRLNDFPGAADGHWNGRFRDDCAASGKGMTGRLVPEAQRLSGNPDLYGGKPATVGRTITFITAHDGFTLAGPGQLRPQAQPGQRRERPRRGQPQQQLEPRCGGALQRPGR